MMYYYSSSSIKTSQPTNRAQESVGTFLIDFLTQFNAFLNSVFSLNTLIEIIQTSNLSTTLLSVLNFQIRKKLLKLNNHACKCLLTRFKWSLQRGRWWSKFTKETHSASYASKINKWSQGNFGKIVLTRVSRKFLKFFFSRNF